jgi:predicted kinase
MEFNEEIATTDILYDAGFVVMDLLARGLHGHAAVFTARYLSATRDYAGLALLPLFVSLRAAVRAIPTVADDPEAAASRLTQAVNALQRRLAARLVAVGGPSGSGKSTVARGLAAGMGDPFFAVVLRSDVARKRLMGVAPEEPLPEDSYRRATGAEVYRRLRCDARRSLLAGFDAIVDASFLDTEEQGALRALANRHGVAFTGLWLTAPADVMERRIRARHDDPSDATPEVLARQIAAAPEAPGWLSIDARAEAETVIRRALEAIQAG